MLDRDEKEKLRALKANTRALEDLGKAFTKMAAEFKKIQFPSIAPHTVHFEWVVSNVESIPMCMRNGAAVPVPEDTVTITSNRDQVTCLRCKLHDSFYQ